jgi:hypothetical protein
VVKVLPSSVEVPGSSIGQIIDFSAIIYPLEAMSEECLKLDRVCLFTFFPNLLLVII